MRLFATVLAFVLLFTVGLEAQHTPPAPKAPEDLLVFTNGDRLTGKLERAVGGSVVFRSDMAGELTVPFTKIQELHSGSEFVALQAGKSRRIKPLGTGSVLVQGGTLTLTPGMGSPENLAVKDLGDLIDVPTYARAVDRRASPFEGWTGAVTAGFTLVRSTQSSTTFTGALNLVRAIPIVSFLPNRNRTTLNVTETYGTNRTPVIPQTTPASPPTVIETNIFHADAERDRYFTPRFYALADLAFDHNFAQGLQLQQLYGAGAGWTAIQSNKEQLDLRGDVHYEKQQFVATAATLPVNPTTGAPSTSMDLIGSTFQENYRRNLPRKFVFTEFANVLPAWNNRKAYSANANMQLTMPLFKRLAASIGATDNYLNDPAPGYRTNAVQFVTGLTFTVK